MSAEQGCEPASILPHIPPRQLPCRSVVVGKQPAESLDLPGRELDGLFIEHPLHALAAGWGGEGAVVEQVVALRRQQGLEVGGLEHVQAHVLALLLRQGFEEPGKGDVLFARFDHQADHQQAAVVRLVHQVHFHRVFAAFELVLAGRVEVKLLQAVGRALVGEAHVAQGRDLHTVPVVQRQHGGEQVVEAQAARIDPAGAEVLAVDVHR